MKSGEGEGGVGESRSGRRVQGVGGWRQWARVTRFLAAASGDIQRVGDLLEGEVLIETKENGGAVGGGEARDGGIELVVKVDRILREALWRRGGRARAASRVRRRCSGCGGRFLMVY